MTHTIVSASNPRFANSSGTVIGLTVVFDYSETPVEKYCVAENSFEIFAKEIFAKAVAGDYGKVAKYNASILDVASLYVEEVVNPVPSQISMRQCRLQLLSDGLMDAVNAAINGLPSPQKEAAEIEWEYSAVVQRTSPLIAGLAPTLGLDKADMDQLFINAAQL